MTCPRSIPVRRYLGYEPQPQEPCGSCMQTKAGPICQAAFACELPEPEPRVSFLSRIAQAVRNLWSRHVH